MKRQIKANNIFQLKLRCARKEIKNKINRANKIPNSTTPVVHNQIQQSMNRKANQAEGKNEKPPYIALSSFAS